jgi:hypothetical protein
MCCKKHNLLDLSTKKQFLERLLVATFKLPVATCGDRVGQHCSTTMTGNLSVKGVTFDSLDQIFGFFVEKTTEVCRQQKYANF